MAPDAPTLTRIGGTAALAIAPPIPAARYSTAKARWP